MSAKLKTETFATEDGETFEVTHGSGNVFADLGDPDAEMLQFKSGLIFEIERVIEARGLTPSEAAKITGISQATLSNLLRGRYFEISTDQLFEMLNRLGRDVEVRVGSEDKAPGAARVTVLAA